MMARSNEDNIIGCLLLTQLITDGIRAMGDVASSSFPQGRRIPGSFLFTNFIRFARGTE